MMNTISTMNTRVLSKLAAIFLVLMLLAIIVFGQSPAATINEGSVIHDGESRPCLVIRMEPEAKAVKGAWKSYLAKDQKVKLKGKKVMEAIEVEFPTISPKTMDFFTKIQEDKNGTEMMIFSRLGYDTYLTSQDNGQEWAAMERVAKTFLTTFLGEFYNRQVVAAQKAVDKAIKSREKMESKSTSLSEKNADMTAKIEAMQADIQKNESEVKDLMQAIDKEAKFIDLNNSELDRLRAKLASIPR